VAGCPAPTISRRGAGPAQLRRRSKIKGLFQVLQEWKQTTNLPNIGAVGAKIRLGNNAREQHYKVYLPVAEAAADCELDYLTVHARHGKQRSRDLPTWEAIGEIKEVVSTISGSLLKVIGNGDVRTRADVVQMQELTKCDGVMIGRAAMQNPWCFRTLAGLEENDDDDDDVSDDVSDDYKDNNTEWPSIEEVDRAAAMNEQWPAKGKSGARYQRFRQENFERLRREAQTAHDSKDKEGDWYKAWSRAATRRRHLDGEDDKLFQTL
jgi:tRNA-dihydrouridine synthase